MSEHGDQRRENEGKKVVPDLKTFRQEEIIKLAVEGGRLRRKINLELGKDSTRRLNAGSSDVLLGYLNKLFCKEGQSFLEKGDLVGIRIADVGGGSYSDASDFGPNLARVLSYLGADVSLIDPEADADDANGVDGLSFFPQRVEDYTAGHADEKFDMVISNAFFGSPRVGETPEDFSRLIFEMSKLSPVQIHSSQHGEYLSEDEFLKVVHATAGKVKLKHFPAFSGESETAANFTLVDNRIK